MTDLIIVSAICGWIALLAGYGRHRYKLRLTPQRQHTPGMCRSLAECLSNVHRAQCAAVDRDDGTAPTILEHATKPITHAHWFHPLHPGNQQRGGAA